MKLRAPFPWFGGKSRVADIVWKRFGDVPNYVEPFAGSLAVLLSRQHWPWDGNRIETVNDMDCYLANFWRALHAVPDEVASWCDWPVNEADLHARHLWLVNTARERVERLRTEPDFYDAKIAGWWVWGICQWIGSGWCSLLYKRLPHLGNAGVGVHRTTNGDLHEYLSLLSDRIRGVRVCCGDWSRVCGETPTVKQGLTGVFLDPPYSAEAGRDENIYAVENLTVAHDVREWAIEHGDDPKLRIALCGYEGEHEMPDSWECVAWKARGGYGTQGNDRGRENAGRERIWFSPHCVQVDRVVQRDLFAEVQ